LSYHLTAIVDWVQGGSPGSLSVSSYDFPTEYYPITNEVLVAWAMGISRSFAAATLWVPVSAGLLGASAWVGLRQLAVPRVPAALSVAAVCSLTLVAGHVSEVENDVPAAAWLACAGALAAGARARPRLAAPALVAVGLAVGSKTTTIALSVLLVVALAVAMRARLTGQRRLLVLATAAAAAVGLPWYTRSLIEHGSPLWPFVALPWGDPVPRLLELQNASFLEHPFATLEGRLDDYAKAMAGATALLAAPLLAPLIARTRATVAASAAAGGTVLLWGLSPITGRGDVAVLDGFSVSTLRYLLPALLACVLALALAARDGGRLGSRAAAALLGAAIALNLVRDATLGFPWLPGLGTLVAGAAIGVAAAYLTGLAMRRMPRVLADPRLAGIAPAVAAVAAGAALAIPASGYVDRHARIQQVFDSRLIGVMAALVDLDRGDTTIAMTRQRTAMLAGDRLKGHVTLLPRDAPCGALEQRPWLVVRPVPRSRVRGHPGERYPPADAGDRCRLRRKPLWLLGDFRIYGPRGRRGHK